MKKIATIKIIWSENRLFFYLLAALFIVGLFPFFILDKCSFFILLKQWHHPVADSMAPYLTLLGDGFVYLAFLVVLALLRVSCRKIMIMGGSFLAMSVVVQLLKRVFFSHMLRPMGLLLADASLHLVDGVPLLTDLSFPSGHSATIFTLVSVIQLLCNNKKNIYSLALVGAALIVAYSRIYLCQHFYIDVYVGACIGTLATVASYWVALQFNGLDWLDRSIYFLLYTNGNRCTIKK